MPLFSIPQFYPNFYPKFIKYKVKYRQNMISDVEMNNIRQT